MNTKVTLTLDQIKTLLATARERGTSDAWCDLALQWMEAANSHISNMEEAKMNAGEAAIDGFLYGRNRNLPVAHELVAGLDDGPSWCPEEWYEQPFCRMVYAVDRGDPSVGIPPRSSFVLAEDQGGTTLEQIVHSMKEDS